MRISVAIDALRRADLGTLQIASVGAFALHNCEEIPNLSDWISRTVPSLGHLVTCGARGILIAATLLTVCYALAVFFTYRKSGTIPLVVFATAYSAVLANAIAHVALAAVLWAYVPGLVFETRRTPCSSWTAGRYLQSRASFTRPRCRRAWPGCPVRHGRGGDRWGPFVKRFSV